VQADVFSVDQKRIFTGNAGIDLGATDVKESIDLEKVLKEAQGISFVILNLRDKAGNVVSHNSYWISRSGDYRALNDMSSTGVETMVLKSETDGNDRTWKIRIRNNQSGIAFFIRPQVLMDGDEILPSFWSQGYFTLAPGEATELTLTCPLSKLSGGTPMLKVSGWNVPASYKLMKD